MTGPNLSTGGAPLERGARSAINLTVAERRLLRERISAAKLALVGEPDGAVAIPTGQTVIDKNGRSMQTIQATHGTETGYTNYKCKCESCRESARLARKRRRQTPNVSEHGKYGGYSNGCRCDDCRRAHADRQRVYQAGVRARRRASATDDRSAVVSQELSPAPSVPVSSNE